LKKRFSKISKIDGDYSKFPFNKKINSQVTTNKNKSQEFGEVFTPLWLVDDILNIPNLNQNSKTLDLCAGYGQFSVRLLRKLYNKYKNFDVGYYLKNNHYFCELQLSSCYKLIFSFGLNINIKSFT